MSVDTLFYDLFEYNHYSNSKILNSINECHGQVKPKVFYLLSHIQNAHHIWNCRILNITPEYAVFQEHNVQLNNTLNEENYKKSIYILQNHPLDTTISYTTSTGEKYTNIIQEILFHVINHSTYHRAQIATLYRESGLNPITTDYISFKRQLK